MAYIGIGPASFTNNLTNVQILDDISSGFGVGGTPTTFNLTANSVPFQAVSDRALMVILGGVIQAPGVDYTINGSQITFTTAPLSGLTFYARNIYGLNALNGVNDGIVGPPGLTTGGPSWDSSGNTTISGNLTVQGATTTIQSTTLDVIDKDIKLASNQSNNAGIDTAGLLWGTTAVKLKFYNNSGTNPGLNIEGTNVGINNSAPEYTLDMVGSQLRLKSNVSGSNAVLRLWGQNTSTGGAIVVQNSAGNAAPLLFYNSNTNEAMRISSAGLVGINETSPTSLLHIVDDSTASTPFLHLKGANDKASIRLENTADNPDNIWDILPSISGVSNTGFTIRDVTDSANRLVIDGSGNVGINESNPQRALHIGSGGIFRFERGDGTRYGELWNDNSFVELKASTDPIRLNAQSYIRFDIADGEKLRITSGGNLKLPDDAKIELGGGQTGAGDLQIYHAAGADSTIHHTATSGSVLRLRSRGFTFKNQANSQTVATFTEGDACKLFFSGGEKIATTGSGITVTGEVLTDKINTSAINITSGLESPYDQTGSGETIFVYDTRNDADGGAWRKKCIHTSWYNEGSGTYRGSRKEFPAVAIIVLGQVRVTIYDGDDPSMPMWMKFRSSSSGYMIGNNDDRPSCVTALNGVIYIGAHNAYGGFHIIDFIKDQALRVRAAVTSNGTHGWWPTGIAGRNGTDDSGGLWMPLGRGYDNTDVGTLKSDDIWSVSVKALKGAPIDPLTNLPIPTIAVAVDSGISIIKPEWHLGLNHSNTSSYQQNDVGGHIVDINSGNGSYTQGYSVQWTDTDDLLFVMGDGNGDYCYIHTMEGSITADNTITIDTKSGTSQNVRSMWRGKPSSSTIYDNLLSRGSDWSTSHNTHQMKIPQVVAKKGYEYAARMRNGLNHIYEDPEGSKSMVAYTTKDYCTGWMVGKEKLCIMADSDTTNITANRLEPNNSCTSGPGLTEANSTSGWTNNGMATFESSNTRAYHGSYSLHLTADTNGDFCHTTFTTVVGKIYTVSCKLYVTHDSFTIKVGTTAGSGNEHFESNPIGVQSYWQHFTGSFQATTTTTYFNITESSTSQDSDGWIDDVVFTEGVPDHTNTHGFAGSGGGLNFNRGTHIYGTITKSAVATGSDLVAYSGWSNNNFLYMPCHPDLNYGANDFSVYWWMNPNDSSSGRAIWSIDNRNSVADNAAASYIRVYFNGDDIRWDLSTAGYAYQSFQKSLYPHPQDSNAWMLCHIIRRDEAMELWVNGRRQMVKELDSGMKGSPIMNELSELRIGQDSNTGSADNEIQLALFRSSAAAPSPHQIKKMYMDELPLFQENAKCTLVGSTNDHIEAMSYDKRSDILYVGGKGGRADFIGLTRINNNTTEVTRGMSASNGLVVEH